MNIDQLHERGFDLSVRYGAARLVVGCSRCDARVVNGTPVHERGCPHAMHECNGCNELIPVRQRYCDDCR